MNIEKVWEPIPGSSQELALDSRADHTLYSGTRGPGKTDTQLMRFRRRVGIGYGAFWRGIIFDREYKNLEDLISKSKKWFPKFDDGCKFKSSAGSLSWTWPTGEELFFRVAKTKDDYWKYHGHEYTFIGWNELTKYPTPELYDLMMSINRTSFRPEDHPLTIDRNIWEKHKMQVFVEESHPNAMTFLLPEIPLEVFSTTNPHGIGHSWVKRRFIDVAPFGTLVKNTTTVFNPRTKQKEDVTLSQVAIHGSWSENIYLTKAYIANLQNEKDPIRRKAWFGGSWDIVSGGAVSDLWVTDTHIVPRFAIPKGWRIARGFDWGSTQPFYVGWYAVANGESATIVVGNEQFSFCPVPGSIILFHEWYGTEEIGTNIGLKMSARDIAKGIKEREGFLIINGWIPEYPEAGPADNSIRDVRESDTDTIEKKMQDEDVYWESSDKSGGSRRNGLQLIRDRLQASVEGEKPGIYFMAHCAGATGTIPTLPRCEKDPDDVDTKSEDHPYDVVRYIVLEAGAPLPPTNLGVVYPG